MLAIEVYVNKQGNLIPYEDSTLEQLKIELKSLEKKLQKLSENKLSKLADIEKFTTQYNIRLGSSIENLLELKQKILQQQVLEKEQDLATLKTSFINSKKELLQTKDEKTKLEEELQKIDDFDDAYDEIYEKIQDIQHILSEKEQELESQRQNVRNRKKDLEEDPVYKEYQEYQDEYEAFHSRYEQIVEDDRNSGIISDEELKELKSIYRKAVRFCHPDIVEDKFKDKAHDIMAELNDAYMRKMLDEVEEIYHNLKTGELQNIEQLEDAEKISKRISKLQTAIKKTQDEIAHLKEDPTYITIKEIADWDEYFDTLKSQLEEQYFHLTKKLKVEIPEINIEETEPSLSKMDHYIQRFFDIVSDYRNDENLNPTPEIIERWIDQFSEEHRETILTEMIHIFQQMYISKSQIETFLENIVTNEDLTGNIRTGEFWENVSLLNIQKDGASQDVMVDFITHAIFEYYSVDVAVNDYSKQHFIYIDDILFSGKKLQTDLTTVMDKVSKNAKIDIFYIAYYSTGKYYISEQWLKRNNSKNINIKVWETLELENRRSCKNAADALVPVKNISNIAKVESYLNSQEGEYAFRDPTELTKSYCKGNNIFSSEENRQILEREFTLAGLKINSSIKDIRKRAFWRPLGLTSFSGLGFGAMIVTHRNCPNNTPLALWWGDWDENSSWTPLFLRKTYNRGNNG